MCACVRCVNAALSTSAGDRYRTKNLSAHKIVVQPTPSVFSSGTPTAPAQHHNRSANTATESPQVFWIVALTQRFCGVGCFCMMSGLYYKKKLSDRTLLLFFAYFNTVTLDFNSICGDIIEILNGHYFAKCWSQADNIKIRTNFSLSK